LRIVQKIIALSAFSGLCRFNRLPSQKNNCRNEHCSTEKGSGQQKFAPDCGDISQRTGVKEEVATRLRTGTMPAFTMMFRREVERIAALVLFMSMDLRLGSWYSIALQGQSSLEMILLKLWILKIVWLALQVIFLRFDSKQKKIFLIR
jgi:hypothetical protein